MPGFVVERCKTVVTCDPAGTELHDADIVVDGGVVVGLGEDLRDEYPSLPAIDGRDLVALPGLINAHQHITQVGFRSLAGSETSPIGPWLQNLGAKVLGRWRAGAFGAAAVHDLARAGFVESVLTGVTTVADQHYHFPADPDDEPAPGTTTAADQGAIDHLGAIVSAANAVGIRVNAGVGAITRGPANGGRAPAELVQDLDRVLHRSALVIERFHDAAERSMTRIDLAPCGVHTDLPELYRELAGLADDHDHVGLHTHCYERVDTEFAAAEGTTPWRWLVDNGWARPGTWLAHMVDAPISEMDEIASAGVGVVHLVAPDLRMGWGLAPVRAFLDHGCTVGFGTTGSASNDGANLMADLRLAALAHRLHGEPSSWPTVRELISMATTGSAACDGRPNLGTIAVGAPADIACWDLSTVDRVGIDDHVAGLVLTGISDRASLVVVDGEIVVRDGRCLTVDETEVARSAQRWCR